MAATSSTVKEPKLWGCLVSSKSWAEDAKEYGLYRFGTQTSTGIEKIFADADCFANGGARVHDGRYGVTFCDDTHLEYGVIYTYYYEYDYSSGRMVRSKQEVSNTLAALETAQYDATGEVYGVYYNANLDAMEYGKADFDDYISIATYIYCKGRAEKLHAPCTFYA